MRINYNTNFHFFHCLAKYQHSPVAVTLEDCELLWLACESLQNANYYVKSSFYEMLLRGHKHGMVFGGQNKFIKLVKRFRELCPDDWQHFEQDIVNRSLEHSMSSLSCG